MKAALPHYKQQEAGSTSAAAMTPLVQPKDGLLHLIYVRLSIWTMIGKQSG